MANSSDRAVTLADIREIMRKGGRQKFDKFSAFNSLERILGRPLANIPADYEHVRDLIAHVHPADHQITVRTWLNIRSRCNVAMKEVMTGSAIPNLRHFPLTDAWREVQEQLQTSHERHTLSPLIRWANASEIAPPNVSDEVIRQFDRFRGENLRPDKARYRRGRVKIWNDLAARSPHLGLTVITVHPISRVCGQIRWHELPNSFQDEFAQYSRWAEGRDLFESNARERPLAKSSLQQQKKWLLSAADALVKSGVDIQTIQSFRDLLGLERLKAICEYRFEKAGRKDTTYNFQVGLALFQVAEWLGIPEDQLAQIRKITRHLKAPPGRMAVKNRKIIRPFEDPDLRARLVGLPQLLFEDARRNLEPVPTRLSKLQAGLAIGALTLFNMRIGNVVALSFERHIDINNHCATIFLPAEEVKNDEPLEFDIPPFYANLLQEYRNHLFPFLYGFVPDFVFSDPNGNPKRDYAIRNAVEKYTRLHLGFAIHPHAFRHMAAKMILDEAPGAYPLVQDLLGHKSLRTTASFYAGPDTKRAGRYLTKLLMRDIASQAPDRNERP